ncbi:hypothetical protein [Parvularcula marina]|uniref:PH domain-containing protein n=1 Tax=Parvularcula marina TaxID=2292771 RepID=A0A371RHZ0_9PROT|nr:hypothetical protein [Parvularcula marina]RFB05074.1 hypothetical protein DX908_07085 [Parvularcula marina]
MSSTSINIEDLPPETSAAMFNKLIARFWFSPFAISAATIVVAELMLLAGKVYGGMEVSGDVLAALTFLAAAMLVAGTMPGWNCLKWDDTGLDQHAGLTHFHVDWSQVKSVSPMPGGLRISYVDTDGARPVVKRGFIQNRYAMEGEKFRRLIEEQWLDKASLS